VAGGIQPGQGGSDVLLNRYFGLTELQSCATPLGHALADVAAVRIEER
jgi:hypothetical protein